MASGVETLHQRVERRPSLDTLVEIRSGRGHASLQELREIYRFREVLSAFVIRLVKVKYKQAAIGFGWSFLQPIASAALFALFMGRFAKLSSEGVPYILFALCGTACWSYFSTALTNAMESVVREASLIRKVYFPRELLPLSSVLAALVDFAPAVLTVLVASVIQGTTPGIEWLALPLSLLILALTALGLGLGLSGLNVYYRDFRYALPFLVQMGLFASPVVYSLATVPARWRTPYAILNPVAASIDGVRREVLHHQWPSLTITGGALLWSLLLVLGGYALFKRLERGFADRA